ncbi:MAG: hypothetical protein AABZ53_16855 [Planctomycetota bacterium]
MTPNQKRATELRQHLEKWLKAHKLLKDGVFDTPEDPEAIDTSQGAKPTYLVLRFDGSLYDLFYERENDKVRAEFDRIVADHGFWYDFYDSTTLDFMDAEGPPAPEDEGPPTPEQEAFLRKRREDEAFLDDLAQSGWKSDGSGGLCDPNDPDVSMWYNPLTSELLLSPKCAERVRAGIAKAQGGPTAGMSIDGTPP